MSKPIECSTDVDFRAAIVAGPSSRVAASPAAGGRLLSDAAGMYFVTMPRVSTTFRPSATSTSTASTFFTGTSAAVVEIRLPKHGDQLGAAAVKAPKATRWASRPRSKSPES
jgi:hypothetical protein